MLAVLPAVSGFPGHPLPSSSARSLLLTSLRLQGGLRLRDLSILPKVAQQKGMLEVQDPRLARLRVGGERILHGDRDRSALISSRH